MKKLLSLVLALTMVLSLGAIAFADGPIALTVWGAEEDQTYLAERIEAFKAAYPDQEFDITLGVESESTAKDTILTDVEAAADVYAFASDQLPDLVNAGAILDLSTVEEALKSVAGKSLDDIKAANVEGSITAATYNDTFYAFPFASDGFFMFYDPDYISEEDAQTWEGLLDAAAAAGKKVGMTLASGWYNTAFFNAAGFSTSLNADGTTNMDWNGTSPDGYTGVQVVQAMQAIAGHDAFMAIADGDISNQIAGGDLAAVISGTWDTALVSDTFGEDYMACALPLLTLGEDQVPTRGTVSFKMIGVNPYAENAGWAVMLAEFLTNEESQVARFEAREIPPTNIAASESEAVQANKGVVGLTEAAAVGVVQSVGGKYWDPTASFGEQIAQGTIGTDEASIQTALDQLVEGVTAAVG